ncbi:Rrf2 family transcriptional regulator [Rickettsiaceae bacterium]|nr:Rrf2 family transcriptional regulator [Rickettsiaceae bacterium]
MMLTTKSRYAVMAIMELASDSAAIPIKLADVSERQTIPLNYLEQIFLKLKKAGLVSAVKGPGGGYYLNSSSGDITIESIIDAMEENLKMTRCSKDNNCRKGGVNCKTHNLWKGLSRQIRNYFAGISVADVMSGKLL